MLERLRFQLAQFRAAFPAPGSLAFNLLAWWHDLLLWWDGVRGVQPQPNPDIEPDSKREDSYD